MRCGPRTSTHLPRGPRMFVWKTKVANGARAAPRLFVDHLVRNSHEILHPASDVKLPAGRGARVTVRRALSPLIRFLSAATHSKKEYVEPSNPDDVVAPATRVVSSSEPIPGTGDARPSIKQLWRSMLQ
ncbi:hypothetical protein EVAR_76241_1 [Eumeta japonica]|uniref:Uncharacterized protein n=1 Tax=Eumeta variegata TaxID=151549 RepID=A0A4C1UQ91_EUMVA|nr:hypothetical protein EVAR_76241_1 [Eumeta japonica]